MPLSESELYARVRKVLKHKARETSVSGSGISQHPKLTAGDVAAMIDHTALKADADDDQIREVVQSGPPVRFRHSMCEPCLGAPLCGPT